MLVVDKVSYIPKRFLVSLNKWINLLNAPTHRLKFLAWIEADMRLVIKGHAVFHTSAPRGFYQRAAFHSAVGEVPDLNWAGTWIIFKVHNTDDVFIPSFN